MIVLLLACSCIAPEPEWDGDTLTLTSIQFYWAPQEDDPYDVSEVVQ